MDILFEKVYTLVTITPQGVRRKVEVQEMPRNAYNTISGLVLDQLKHIPATGEKLRWNSFDLEIVDMDGVRIDKILVTHDQVSES